MKTLLRSILAGVLLLFLLPNPTGFAQDTCWWQCWEKSDENPLFPVDDEIYWFDAAYSKAVLYDNGIYRMWFSAWESGTGQFAKVSYAESENGTDWVIDDQPQFSGGPEGAWNHVIFVSSVLFVDDTLRMWYTGSPTSNPSVPSIGYAWSLDGETWSLHPEAVLNPPASPGPFNSICEILYDNDTYHMYFGNAAGISYAWSTDGITWTLFDDNPVMEKLPGTFYDYGMLPSGLTKENDTIHMWFSGAASNPYWRIGYAWSTDFVTWTVNDEIAMNQGPLNDWDGTCVFDAHVLLDDGIFKMWFTGFKTGSTFRIGYAEGPSASNLCLADGHNFTAQADVDDFPVVYPYCTKVVGPVTIDGDGIKNLLGLGQIETFEAQLKISNNDSLQSLNGLDEVNSIGGKLTIHGNPMLNSLQDLSSLGQLGDGLQVTMNESLENFIGLEELSLIAGDLMIGQGQFGPAGNPNLTSLIGLDYLDSVGGLIKIMNNEKLSLCAIESLCYFIDDTIYSDRIFIENNDVGCASLIEVDSICDDPQGNDELPALASHFLSYPNPFKNNNTITYRVTNTETVYLAIYNLVGKELHQLVNREQKAGDYKLEWNAHDLPPGVYFAVLRRGENNTTKKLIKLE